MSRPSRPVLVLGALATTLTVVLAGCSDSPEIATTEAAAETGVRVVEPQAAADLLDAEPERTVVDVRTPAEYAEGHLPGAVLVDYNAPDFEQRIAEFDRDASYVIYCRSGNRSAGARQVMQELGFTDVVDVAGGIVAWTDAGLPVTAA